MRERVIEAISELGIDLKDWPFSCIDFEQAEKEFCSNLTAYKYNEATYYAI